jgi:hypothetical protein
VHQFQIDEPVKESAQRQLMKLQVQVNENNKFTQKYLSIYPLAKFFGAKLWPNGSFRPYLHW